MEVLEIPTFEDLRNLVRRTLCARADLHADTPLVEIPLVRRNRPCGIEFVLVGPRSERLSAIWESDTGRLLCYDQNLERFHAGLLSGPLVDAEPMLDIGSRCVWQGR